MFSSICGSSVATAAAIGTVMIPEMVKRGYDRTLCVGLIASAGGLGILLPPSVTAGGLRHGDQLDRRAVRRRRRGGHRADHLPGHRGLHLRLQVRRGAAAQATAAERWKAFKAALGVLMSPVIVLGGICSGIFTPMEAAAVSCVYALALALFYGQTARKLLAVLTDAATTSSLIILILAGAQLFGYAMTNERVPHAMFRLPCRRWICPGGFYIG